MSSLFAAPAGVRTVSQNRRAGRRWMRLVLLLVVAFVAANAAGGVRGLTAFRDATDAFATLSDAVVRLRQENEALRQRARSLREDPAAVEDLARQELGLIRPGEKIFIVNEQPLTTAPLPPAR